MSRYLLTILAQYHQCHPSFPPSTSFPPPYHLVFLSLRPVGMQYVVCTWALIIFFIVNLHWLVEFISHLFQWLGASRGTRLVKKIKMAPLYSELKLLLGLFYTTVIFFFWEHCTRIFDTLFSIAFLLVYHGLVFQCVSLAAHMRWE